MLTPSDQQRIAQKMRELFIFRQKGKEQIMVDIMLSVCSKELKIDVERRDIFDIIRIMDAEGWHPKSCQCTDCSTAHQPQPPPQDN